VIISDLVPTPGLEPGTPDDWKKQFHEITSFALDELQSGNVRHAKSILETLKGVLE
jgi:hypothetical protein